ncbi:myeloid-associated differentiation marker-like isoform X2 [Engraulis encrasicolus]|uniref:myeloid-associated differentiation marker-like isoform X2 n=1 Tax=Engraulis encrasicolus TaxID=184585 RepID=UPI002FD402F7
MPVILGEASILATPLSGVRIWALVSGCITFSLAASKGGTGAPSPTPTLTLTAPDHLVAPPLPQDVVHLHLVSVLHTFCMFVWCFFFVLTLLILAVTFVQFHSLLPFSWKNLTVTVSSLASLLTLVASVAFPWLVVASGKATGDGGGASVVATTIFSCLTCVAYAAETHLLRREQGGYMASVPGLLKVLQVFGGAMALLLVAEQAQYHHQHHQGESSSPPGPGWQVVGPGLAYGLCLAASLFTVAVMVGDCAGRCPVPFDRVLAALSMLGVLLYMAAAVMSSTKVLQMHQVVQHKVKVKVNAALRGGGAEEEMKVALVSEMVFACVTLLSYTVDLAFSVKLLCDRN